MIRSLVLFVHIVSMLTLFAGLAVEWLCMESLQRSHREASSWIRVWARLPRVYGVASALILLSGIYLAARVGVYDFAWVRVSFAALLLMGILGGPVIRSRMRAVFEDGRQGSAGRSMDVTDSLLRASLWLRVGLGLAVVYLMIAKPEAGPAL